MWVIFITNFLFFFAGYTILYEFYLLIFTQSVVLALCAHSVERILMDGTIIVWRYKDRPFPIDHTLKENDLLVRYLMLLLFWLEVHIRGISDGIF